MWSRGGHSAIGGNATTIGARSSMRAFAACSLALRAASADAKAAALERVEMRICQKAAKARTPVTTVPAHSLTPLESMISRRCQIARFPRLRACNYSRVSQGSQPDLFEVG